MTSLSSSNMRILQRLKSFHSFHIYTHVDFSQDYGLLAIITVCTVIYGIIPAIISVLMGQVFDLLRRPNNSFDTINKQMHYLTLRSMAILITGLASVPVCWLSISSWMTLGERQAFRIRRKLLHSYLNKSMAWYDSNEQLSGEFTQLNRCSEELRSSSAEASAIIFQNVVTVIALLGTALYFSWSLTLIIMASSPLVILFAICCSRKIEKYGKLENEETSTSADIMAWSVNAAKMIRLLGTQETEVKRFQKSVGKSREHFNKTALFSSLNYSVLRFLTLCMFVQGFWYGNVQIKNGDLNPGDVMTCFSACILLAGTLNNTLHQVVTLQKGAIALQKIQKFLEVSPANRLLLKRTLDLPSVPVSWRRGSVEFYNVKFAYPTRPNETVLKGVNLKFKAGKLTFIVGKSGSGKSTIGNLMLNLYDNVCGKVEIDGVDVRQIDHQSLLGNITLVEQTTALFNDSLKNNIRMGTHITEDEEDSIKHACQMAMLGNVIRDLARGLDTTIGNSGVDLSGGEQQRVAIARARLRDTPILVLDEALSAQDRVHKSLLMEAIRRWRSEKTTIILTHEFSDIADSDYVYLMEDGEVREEGFKGKLLQTGSSAFAQMHKFQVCADELDDVKTLNGHEQLDQKLRCKGINVDVEEMYSEMGSPSTEKTCSVSGPEDFRMPSTFIRNSTDLLQSNLMMSQRKRRADMATRIDLNGVLGVEISASEDLEKATTEPKLMKMISIMRKLLCTLDKKGLLVVGVLAALLAGVANPLFSYTFSRLLGGIASSSPKSVALRYATKWSLIVLLVAFLDSSFTFLKCYLLSRCGEAWIKTLRNLAFRNIARQNLNWFSNSHNSTSKLSSLLLNDLRDLRALASEFLAAITTLMVVSICGLVWALASGWKLSLVCISLVPIFVLFSGFYGGMLQKYEADYKTSIASLEDKVYDAVRNIKTARCFQFEESIIGEFTTLELVARSLGRKRALGTGFGVGASNGLTFMTQAILLYFGMKLVITGEYSSAKMLQTLTLLLFTIMTCMSLISQIPEISRGQRAATYIFQVVNADCPAEHSCLKSRTSNFSLTNKEPLIRLKNLRFSYPYANNALIYKDLNLEIYKGGAVGLVGRSGSGKSTLWHLITRLYDVSNNSIWIDGTDINLWNAGILRDHIAVVEQKPQFFLGSIIDNLTYGLNREVGSLEVENLLRMVGMQEFVASTPSRLHSDIDTKLLSGGQVQRLAIVRALLRKPKILILDECTSALDAKHGFIMSKFVKKNLNGTTALILTHSEQMMRACSRIVTFSEGAIIEDGCFEELIQQKGELYSILSSSEI